ncbi:MAG: hypothetical protein RIN56_17485 [Sporomusaceae bacterium]|nr:hypothetical protein [Sporomusaceae bacterium]
MEEASVVEMGMDTAGPGPEATGDAPAEADGDGCAGTGAARLPDIESWLPGGSIWLYAVPIILLLFLWLFYPAILILACVILMLWLLG